MSPWRKPSAAENSFRFLMNVIKAKCTVVIRRFGFSLSFDKSVEQNIVLGTLSRYLNAIFHDVLLLYFPENYAKSVDLKTTDAYIFIVESFFFYWRRKEKWFISIEFKFYNSIKLIQLSIWNRFEYMNKLNTFRCLLISVLLWSVKLIAKPINC